MKQKFTFTLDPAQGVLTLSEAGETDPGTFVTVHSETYSLETMKDALAKGSDEFVEALRRNNMFPPLDLAEKLFTALKEFIGLDDGQDTLVVDYEDVEALPARVEKKEQDEDEEVADVIDDLLTVSDDDDVTEDDIKEIDSDDDTLKYLPDDNSEHEN